MRLEHLTWPKVQAYFQESDTVLIAIGSIECHGRHMPVGTDTMIPNRLLELIEEKSGVLIAPTIPYGVSPSLAPIPAPSTWMRRHSISSASRCSRACTATGPGGSWSSTATAAM